MKKTMIIALSALVSVSMGCGTLQTSGNKSGSANTGSADPVNAIINILSGSGETAANVLSSVIGNKTIDQEDLYGTWNYLKPGCSFTSDNLLAKAGGEVAATQVVTKLAPTYQKIGFTAANTQITFNKDQTFSAKVDGKSLSGNYTYDEQDSKVTLQTFLFEIPCYLSKSSSGVRLLFESKKLLTLFQTYASLSGNSQYEIIGDISKNYDGIRLGFEMRK